MMNEKKSIIIICDSDKNVGLGHYSRSIALKNIIKKNFKNIKVSIIVISNQKKFFAKKIKRVTFYNLNKNISKIIDIQKPTHCFFNLSPKFEKTRFKNFIKVFTDKKIKLIAIDNLFAYKKLLNHIWVPNIFLNSKYKNNSKFSYGWNRILIDERKIVSQKRDNSLLIITGGTDKYNLYKKIPPLLERFFDNPINIRWVIGPFAKKPKIGNTKHNWYLYNKPSNLRKIYSKSSVAFVLFGVSFFEIVNYSIPCSVFSPKNKEDRSLEDEIGKKFYISNNLKFVIKNLFKKLQNIKKENFKAKKLAKLIDFKKRDVYIKKII